MAKKRKELTHEEIWDDSGLIASWNHAYEEYKHYHSLHARGENVEEVLVAAAAATAEEGGPPSDPLESRTLAGHDNVTAGTLGTWHPTDETPQSHETGNAALGSQGRPDQQQTARLVTTDGDRAAPPLGMIPALMNSSTGDEPLKNVMMSWYWAGYYTGLHEGQRAAQVAATKPAPGDPHA